MNTLLELLQPPLARRLGWTLLHFCWQGALLAVLFLAARGALHRRSPNARYLAGCLTLLLMAVAPVVTFRTLDVTPAIHHAAAVAATLPPVLPAVMPAGDARPTFDGLARLAVWLDGLIEAALPWLVGAWAMGVFALSSRLGVGWFQVRRLRRRSVEPLDEWLLVQLASLQRRLGVSRPVRLLKSALVEVPTVIGWFRPVILLPASTLTGLSPLQLELILAHELAHLRRGDYWVNLFQVLLETLLFYHPAVWWVSRCVRQDREHCCDDLAVAACGNRLAYAQALATLEELRQLPANVAFAASGGSLLARIKHVLGLPAEAAPSGWRRSVGGALIVLGLLAIAASAVIIVSPTRYRSTATISVHEDPLDADPLLHQEPQEGFGMGNFTPTEFERIQSKAVLYPVIEKFELRKKWVPRYHQGRELSEQDTFTLFLRRHLEVRQSRHSNLIEIRVFSEDREEAAQLANAIAESYRDFRLKEHKANAQAVIEILDGQWKKQTEVVSNLQVTVNNLQVSLGTAASAYEAARHDLEIQERLRDLVTLRCLQERVDASIPATPSLEIIDMAEPGLAPVWPNFAMAGALAAGGLVLIFAGVSLCRRGPAVGLPAAV